MKLAVIMSTFNGEKFLEEQINSILNQNVDLELYIHDDGSTDHTLKILNKISSENSNIHLFQIGKKMGVVKSFLNLLTATSADYYMFSDQDDIWESDKATQFIKKAQLLNSKVPGLVYSELLLVDQSNTALGETMASFYGWKDRESEQTVSKLLFSHRVTGASMLINNAMKEFVVERLETLEYSSILMHDAFMAKIAMMVNNIIFLDQPLTRYRQHQNNAVGVSSKKTPFKRRADIFAAIYRETLYVYTLIVNSNLDITNQDAKEMYKMMNKFFQTSYLRSGINLFLDQHFWRNISFKKRVFILIYKKRIYNSLGGNGDNG